MDSNPVQVTEETLDPQNWEEVRELGHQMLDDMFEHLQTLRDRPAWQAMPQDVREFLKQPAPDEGQPREQIYEDFKKNVLPYHEGTPHPRFWSWVIGQGTPFGMLADMLASGINSNLANGDHSPNEVEKQVIRWMISIMGFPETASGILVSGGSMANFNGLTVARNAMAGYDIRKLGVSAAPRPMVLYASQQTHSSVRKAVEMLGLGNDNLRMIPVNADFEIAIPALREAIGKDKVDGLQPFCVVGNAGTVNTGASDDLNALADIAAEEKLWFHVDGAFGAWARIAPESSQLVAGMDRADSLAFDLHKWMYMNYEAGVVLVRREDDQRNAFSVNPAYLVTMPRGLAGGSNWFQDYGLQLSRSFRALKAWMSIKEHGIAKYGRLVQQNIDQASYLAGLVDAAPELERVAPAPLNIVCFRYVQPGKDTEALNALNQEILMRLQENGIALPSYTKLGDVWAIRAAITNHRSRREDFELLVREVIRIGKEVVK